MAEISLRIQELEKEAVAKAKRDKNFDSNFEMSYFSGLLNGYNFAFFLMNNELTDSEIDGLLGRLSHRETIN